MPLAAVAVSWLAVRRSKHPWAINVREGWSPLWLGVALVQVSSLLIIAPQSIQCAYLFYGILHLL